MIKTFFINSTQALYDDSEFAALQSTILDEGVFADSEGSMGLQVTQADITGMNVKVAAGKAFVEITKSGRTFKVFVVNDAALDVAIAANGGGANRVDAIIVRVDVDTEPNVLKNNVATIERVAGDGASALSDEDITAAVGSDGWIRLADVTVTPAETTILNGDITDTRTQVELNDAVRINLAALSDLDATQGAEDQAQTGSASSSAVGQTDTAGGRRRVAQSFIATRKGIRSAYFYKKANTGTFTGSIAFSVQADVGGAPSGTPLASYTMPNAEYLALANDAEFEVKFDAQYSPFTEGATYWLVAIPSTGDNANCPNFGAATGNPYANGNLAYWNTDDGWVNVSGTDLYFRTIELTAEQLVRTDDQGHIPPILFASKIVRTYTEPGNYTWRREGKAVLVEVWGAGGGGGGRSDGGSGSRYGSGGGGGAYMWKIFDCSSLPGNVTVTVGAGGIGGGASGNNGGQSQFNNNAFPNNFGYGGQGNNNWPGGGGGSGNEGSPVGVGGNNSDVTLSAAARATFVPYGLSGQNQSFRAFNNGLYSGGGGIFSASNGGSEGGRSIYGGGGGAGANGSNPVLGGNSKYAGKGGNANFDPAAGVFAEAGSYPAGGGGASGGNNLNLPKQGGNGANGMVRITVL